MNSSPIGVFDSGIGGTTILKSVRKLLPNENYVFFGDSANCPFGTKNIDELKSIVRNATDFLIKKGAKIIIVACNTATTQTIEYLRELYPNIPFVGTEPAVKLACGTGKKMLLLLSTEGTAHSPRTQELIEQNIRPNQQIVNLPCIGLAEAIETTDADRIHECLVKNFKNVEKPEEVDIVILGCTHYPLASEQIKSFFPNASLLDGGDGVARQTQKILSERKLLSPNTESGTVEYFFSKKVK